MPWYLRKCICRFYPSLRRLPGYLSRRHLCVLKIMIFDLNRYIMHVGGICNKIQFFEQIYHGQEEYLRTIQVAGVKISRAWKAREIYTQDLYFLQIPRRSWYICLITPNINSKRTDDVGTNTPASISVKGKKGIFIFANTTAQGKKGIVFRQIPLATRKGFKLRKFA